MNHKHFKFILDRKWNDKKAKTLSGCTVVSYCNIVEPLDESKYTDIFFIYNWLFQVNFNIRYKI